MPLYLIISQEKSKHPFGQPDHFCIRKAILRFIPMG
ncbi:hypothetical protein BMETH_1456_1 [methanotrophic bacterial endosymbiont of Bathymodiolus sp.]|nr:hypothetical protein BMETH_1456_1 [methanotrophic bacterial endosymbiont of Bathymodiolus sp.]